MSKEIYISSTPHETRLAIVEKEELSEVYYERENEYTLAGSIYNGRVTRVLPGMQSAFVDIGLERDAFLYITDFLEEQGESAEFEGGGGEGRRESPQRAERGGERGGGGERPAERGGERTERPERSERGERGRRGDRDRGPRVQEPREAQPEIQVSPQAVEEVHEAEGEPVEGAAQGEDTGDGSRRWRGRRGRRRGGRGGEARGPVVQGAEASPAPEPGSAAPHEEPAEPEYVASEPVEQIFGQAEPAARERGGEERSGRERGPRGDRGERGRDRGGDRSGERGGDRGRRSERGRDREEGSGPELQAGAEPMILPGESLSRYRRGENGELEQADASVQAKGKPSYLVATPSTQVEFSVAGWDGGATLPGETLSRRRAPEAASPAPKAAESSNVEEQSTEGADGGSQRGNDRRRDRDRRRGRGGRPEQGAPREARAEAGDKTEDETPTSFRSGAVARETLEPIDAVQPGVSSGHEPEGTAFPLGESLMAATGTSDDVPAFEIEAFEARSEAEATVADDLIYEPETDAAEPAEGLSPGLVAAVDAMHGGVALEPAHAGEELVEETQEYEPGEDASASYRVDPAGPSEYRQSGAADDDDVSEGDPLVQADYAGTEHQYTTIGDEGEMLSELPGEIATDVPTEDPTDPIEHETAVLSAQASEFLREHQALQPAEESGSQRGSSTTPPTFEPGDGNLEEEIIDEDDTEVLDIAASYGDDTEEETFEAGAQIGSLARDLALDQLTQGEMGEVDDEDEDDDFEIDEEEMEEDELDGVEQSAGSEAFGSEDAESDDELLENEQAAFEDGGDKPAAASMGEFPEFAEEQPAQRGEEKSGGEGRREPRRGGGDRGGGRDRGGRGDRRGMANSRGGGGGGRGGRHSMQTTDLPAISDLLKPGQEVLVQIAKEPIAKKGARITSHIALPGRFLVFMPTVNHVGVSRKIESDSERRRLKEILLSEKGEAGGGFIVRTAAMGASEEELRSDLRFLLNLWADIKSRSESSKSPALIYHDLNLVERILRDQVSENFSAIWCDSEAEYERVLRFLQRFEPSLMRRVKLYTKDTPLFDQFGVSEEINKALRSKVWLKSGGSIVINQTEALVAIDINTGKYVGKTARLEDTIVKTNLDAIPEIVRQMRLRDLGGIIVIDFIDMDDRKNRQKVLLALEEELKKDRAPSKVLQFNDFGLVAITRKRVKQSLERTLSTTCGICAGTGMVKSPVTVCNEIYIELRKMHKQLDKGDVMLRVNPEVVKQLKSNNGKWMQEMEEVAGKTILIKSDPSLHPEQFDIH